MKIWIENTCRFYSHFDSFDFDAPGFGGFVKSVLEKNINEIMQQYVEGKCKQN